MHKLIPIAVALLAVSLCTVSAADTFKKNAAPAEAPASGADDFFPTFGEDLAKLRQSIDDYTKQIKKAPKDSQAYFLRSQAYAIVGEHNKARLDRKKALELNPNLKEDVSRYEEATLNIGSTELAIGYEFLRRGKHDYARQKFSSALEANAKNPAAYVGMGVYFQAQKQWPKALEFFKKAIELDPEHNPAFYQRALTYMKMGDHAKALPDLNRLVEKIKPTRAETFYLRSRAYRALKQTENADADYQKAVELDADVASKVPEF